jgi:hypothetical protein
MRLSLRAARLALAGIVGGSMGPACYGSGGGTAPPTNTFYFPTGLAVSTQGNVLYVVNSDFDLQWSGGTLQSYDLFHLRGDVGALVTANLTGMPNDRVLPGGIPFLNGFTWQAGCQSAPPPPSATGNGVKLGENCAPPVDSTPYQRSSVILGAFATDLQLSTFCPMQDPTMPGVCMGRDTRRLFAPVGGSATVTWANVVDDADPTAVPSANFAPFNVDCGVLVDDRCQSNHQTGDDPNSTNNTRGVTMPGEPFGLAQTQDGTAMAVTSETDTKTSLLTTGFGGPPSMPTIPTMQFVVDGLPTGGVGIAAIPHDPLAVTRCEDPMVADRPPCVRQAFLETTRNSAEVDLLRYYDDDGLSAAGASLRRPFLAREVAFPITVNSIGTDSRGIVIDPSQRMLCEAVARAQPDPVKSASDLAACAVLPSRVFIANRSPASIIYGTVGQVQPDGTYNPDLLVLNGNVPLTDGPSKVFIAPIVGADGVFQLRLFVVCFDTSSIFVYDPDTLVSPTSAPETIIYTGPGPFALAFDPFTLEQVVSDIASGTPVQQDMRPLDSTLSLADVGVKRYRFAYVASFTQSFLQVIDLDQSNLITYGAVVYTLGQPTPPKGQ